jgi:hypothetical protein
MCCSGCPVASPQAMISDPARNPTNPNGEHADPPINPAAPPPGGAAHPYGQAPGLPVGACPRGRRGSPVIPEGAGPVNPRVAAPDLSFGFAACSWARRGEASGSRIGPQGRPRSGRRSLTSMPGGARCSRAENGGDLAAPGVRVIGGRVHAPVPVPRRWTGPVGAVGHPFAIRHGVLRRVRGGRGQSRARPRRDPSKGAGVMTGTTRAHRGRWPAHAAGVWGGVSRRMRPSRRP